MKLMTDFTAEAQRNAEKQRRERQKLSVSPRCLRASAVKKS
jgi:hypothetical protein